MCSERRRYFQELSVHLDAEELNLGEVWSCQKSLLQLLDVDRPDGRPDSSATS